MSKRGSLVLAALLGSACQSDRGGAVDAAFQVDASVPETELALDAGAAVDLTDAPAPTVEVTLDASSTVDTGTTYDASSAAVDASSIDGPHIDVCDPGLLSADAPVLLSQTGCFEPGIPDRPNAAFFPYEVNSPLWSDGAVKSRFLRLPAGTAIKVKDCDEDPTLCLPVGQGGTPEDEGHFGLPVGSILIKVFALQGKPVETRFLIHSTENDWARYSYRWNDQATDATLLDDAEDRIVGDQVWHYPSRQECIQCHTAAGGRALGPTTRQLDRETTSGNQLDRLVAMGFLPKRPKALQPYPDPRKPGGVDERARAYLQSNCSFCHRPAGPFSDMDMRFATPLFAMKLCNVPSIRGAIDANVPAIRLVPGDPAASAVSVRMHNRAGYAMPKIGSNVVDPDGSAVVDQWITELMDCPTGP
jgi:mono/diheme cytochrome c family protein